MGAFHKLLYGWGQLQYGIRILSELDPGSPAWWEFVDKLIDSKDQESRSLALDQIREPGFYAGSPDKARVRAMALLYLGKGMADERRTAMQFFVVNRQHFGKDDKDVFGAMFGALQSTDPQVATPAEELLSGWGYDRDSQQMDRGLSGR
ncbi:MAG: hypothetical protein U0166_13005 [Acidobacteriota bacterium]